MKLITRLDFSLFCLYLLIGLSLPVVAQPEVGLAIQYNRPVDELRSDGYKDGIGFSMNILSKSLASDHGWAALQLGGQFDFVSNGKQSEEIIITLPGSDELGNLYVRNHQVGFHGISRVISSDQLPVQLYVDGLLGGILFSTTESYGHEEQCPDESLNLSRALAFSYGASVGSMIRLNGEARLDIRATYLTGSPVRFVDLATVSQTEQNLYTYNNAFAPATQLTFQVGLTIAIDGNCGKAKENSDGFSSSFFSSCFW